MKWALYMLVTWRVILCIFRQPQHATALAARLRMLFWGGRTDLVNSLVNGGEMWPEASVTYVTHALHVADIDGGMHAASTYT